MKYINIYKCGNCEGTEFVFIKQQQNGWQIKQCRLCGLIQVVPHPSKQDITGLYTNDWAHFAPYQSQKDAHVLYFQTLLSFVLPFLTHSKKRLLDVGCATGILLDVCRKRNISASGTDISKDAVQFCKKKGLDVVWGTLQDIASVRHWSHQYTIAIASQVIEHERDPQTFLRSLQSVLVSGGIAVITTPNSDTIWRQIMGDKWVSYQHPEHLFFFSKKILQEMIENAGFQILCIRNDIPRSYTLSYVFRRLSTYFPKEKKIFKFFMQMTKGIPIPFYINPWADMLFVIKKK